MLFLSFNRKVIEPKSSTSYRRPLLFLFNFWDLIISINANLGHSSRRFRHKIIHTLLPIFLFFQFPFLFLNSKQKKLLKKEKLMISLLNAVNIKHFKFEFRKLVSTKFTATAFPPQSSPGNENALIHDPKILFFLLFFVRVIDIFIQRLRLSGHIVLVIQYLLNFGLHVRFLGL